mmetsp:Transcript_50314/g.130972  ORF Transcript_50314/g.130972 Transcript_50314/m.130972 type:complete len:213 (-) Transcript_50314:228-866(-)
MAASSSPNTRAPSTDPAVEREWSRRHPRICRLTILCTSAQTVEARITLYLSGRRTPRWNVSSRVLRRSTYPITMPGGQLVWIGPSSTTLSLARSTNTQRTASTALNKIRVQRISCTAAAATSPLCPPLHLHLPATLARLPTSTWPRSLLHCHATRKAASTSERCEKCSKWLAWKSRSTGLASCLPAAMSRPQGSRHLVISCSASRGRTERQR